MITCTLDTKTLGDIRFVSVNPQMDYEDGKETGQRLNADGIPMWEFHVVLVQEGARTAENLRVRVPMDVKDPSPDFAPFDAVDFDELRLSTDERDGRRWVSFAADDCYVADEKKVAPKKDVKAAPAPMN